MLVGFSNQLRNLLSEVRNGVGEMRDMTQYMGSEPRDYEHNSRGTAGSSITKDIQNTIENSKNLG
jgi:hypothetical protein